MNYYALLPLASFFANMVLAMLIIHIKPKGKLNLLYFLFLLSVAMFSLGDFLVFTASTPNEALGWNVLMMTAASVFPALLLHFFLLYARRPVSKKIYLLYLPALFFPLTTAFTDLVAKNPVPSYWGYSFTWGPLNDLFSLYIVAYILYGLCVCYRYCKKTGGERKAQTRLLMAAVAVPFIGGSVTDIILPLFGIHVFTLSSTLTTFSAVIIFYAVFRHGFISNVSFSIKSKLIVVFMSLILLTGIATFVVSNDISKSIMREEINDMLQSVAKSRSNHIDSFLGKQKQSVELMSSGNSFIVFFDENRDYENRIKELGNQLDKIMKSNEEISKIEILDSRGVVVVSTVNETGIDRSRFDVFQKGMKGTHITDIHMPKDRIPSMAVSTPIEYRGELLGVLVVYLKAEELFKITTDTTGLGKTGEMYLVNRYGYIASPSRFGDDVVLREKIDNKNTASCFNNGEEEKKVRLYKNYRGSDVMGTHEYIKEMGWCLMAEINEEEAFDPIKEMQNTLVSVFMLISILGILFSFFISESITKPIIKLRNVAVKIGKGEMNEKIKIKSRDEIGELSRTFNKMVANLKKYQNKLLESEKKRSEELEKEVNKKTRELNEKLRDTEKARKATLNIMEDLDEVNKELTRAYQELKELDKAKSNFINIVSHELKTPLTAVSAHLDVLDDMKSNLSKQEMSSLEAIRRNTNQLKNLIFNILELSRIEAKRFELDKRELDLNRIIENVMEDIRILSGRKDLKLVKKLGKFPPVIGDEVRIKEVLNNLIGNAIKFTEKGFVTVKTSKQGDFARVDVIDTGIGIPKDKINKLFTKFYQVDSSLGRKYGGTGLGLSISKHLVEIQGGRISVKSQAGKGSTFSFTLPLKK